MQKKSQSKPKLPDNSAIVTHSIKLHTGMECLRAVAADPFKELRAQMAQAADPFKGLRAQMAQATDPLREFRVQMEEMKQANDLLKGLRVRSVGPLKALRVQTEEMKRLSDPLKGLRVQSVDPLKALRVQTEEMKRLSDPLREFRVQMEEMKQANDLLKGLRVRSVDSLKALRVQTEEMKRLSDPLKGLRVRSVDPLKALRVQTEEMKRLSDPLREFRVQMEEMKQANDLLKGLRVRSVDSLKALRVQMVQIDKSVVNFDRILDQIVAPTATFISPLGIDVFIEPKHPDIVEQPSIIPCSDDLVPSSSKRVFIVCGADEGAKQAVARWIEKLGLEAIIIDEQPSGALTRIEKFEKYADSVDFTVVLLTPDDLGKPKDKLGEPNFRASQNVILQLGVLIGKCGRDRICFLCKGELELPSDINGINPVRMGTNGGWMLNLIREMESVGLSVDMHKAI